MARSLKCARIKLIQLLQYKLPQKKLGLPKGSSLKPLWCCIKIKIDECPQQLSVAKCSKNAATVTDFLPTFVMNAQYLVALNFLLSTDSYAKWQAMPGLCAACSRNYRPQ